MDTNVIIVEDLQRQTRRHSDNQQSEDVIQNVSDSATPKHVSRMAKQRPMQPTLLYVSVFVRQ